MWDFLKSDSPDSSLRVNMFIITVSQYKEKLIMFAVPFIIGLLAWIVMTLNEGRTTDQVLLTKVDNQERVIEKMYNTVKEMNVVLYSKADQITTETNHTLLLIKLDDIENALTKRGLMNKTAYIDTMYTDSIIGGKPLSFLHAIKISDIN